MNHITQRKWSYFHPSKKFCYCSGAKVLCQDLEHDGYTTIPWDSSAKNLPIPNIKLLHLEPTREQLKKAILPSFVVELSKLEHAVFDLHFLNQRNVETFPKILRSLILSRNLDHDYLGNYLGALELNWPQVSLGKLEALLLIAYEEKEKLVESLSETMFPKLRFLGFDISQKSELNVFGRFGKLTDLEITGLRDWPVFDYMNHLPLVSLDMGGSSKKFPVRGMTKLTSLKFLRMNSIRAEINCELFTELPKLEEVVILNSKNIVNVEALLNCPRLKRIDFLDCKNPFKGIVTKFQEHGFEHLAINYA